MQPWRLEEVKNSLSMYRPVLALTVLRHHSNGVEILAGARTEEANPTHPGVVSVPTQRVPEVIAANWLSGLDASTGLERETEYLLARKLGVADALELEKIRYKIHDLGAWQGTSIIGENQRGPVTEDLTMFNACVEIVEGSELFPTETASYKPLLWVPVSRFLTMVAARDVAALGIDNLLLFCAYGLCLESSARILKRLGLSAPGPHNGGVAVDGDDDGVDHSEDREGDREARLVDGE